MRAQYSRQLLVLVTVLVLVFHGCSRAPDEPAEMASSAVTEPPPEEVTSSTDMAPAPDMALPPAMTAPPVAMDLPPATTMAGPDPDITPPAAMEPPADMAAMATSPEPPKLVDKELRFVQVFYGTDRERTAPCRKIDTTDWRGVAGCIPNEFYGSQIGALEVGTVRVTFPPGHRKGDIERPPKIFVFTLRKENPDKDVLIAELNSFGDRYEDWVRDVRNTGRKQAFIYVHGYANSFAESARRAAQVAYDLDFDVEPDFRGLTMMYSWPSKGKATAIAYNSDRDASRNAAETFNEFLDLISEDAGVELVHVIAHSMGNRLVANALQSRAASAGSDSVVVDQLVLAAPDIWADGPEGRFLKSSPKLAERVTLYVSDKDRALAASDKWSGGHRRVGHVDGGFLQTDIERLDPIDASALRTDFLGHSYYADNDSMLSDIYCLFKHNPPDKRPLIRRRAAGTAWEFIPSAELAALPTTMCRIWDPPGPGRGWIRHLLWLPAVLVLFLGILFWRRRRAEAAN